MKFNHLDYVLNVNSLEELDFKNLRETKQNSLLILRGLISKMIFKILLIKLKSILKLKMIILLLAKAPKIFKEFSKTFSRRAYS